MIKLFINLHFKKDMKDFLNISLEYLLSEPFSSLDFANFEVVRLSGILVEMHY